MNIGIVLMMGSLVVGIASLIGSIGVLMAWPTRRTSREIAVLTGVVMSIALWTLGALLIINHLAKTVPH